MNKTEQQQYLEEYHRDKEHGVPFFPDIVFKDMVGAGLIFVILVGLVIFVGVPLEGQANPADANYIPRPEWYFLWVYQALKYFPGNLEAVATVGLPGLGILLLLLLPFYDRSPRRHPRRRPLAAGLMALVVVGIMGLTWQAVVTAPKPQAAVPSSPEAQAALLYTQNCAACHGAMVTVRTGADLHKIIAEGLSHEGMPAWGGNFTGDEIKLLVSYISAPDGAELFRQDCTACHDLSLTSSGGADALRQIISAGPTGQVHQGQNVANWGQLLDDKQVNALVNFVLAPQPNKLYGYYCSSCHGSTLNISPAGADQLRQIIRRGGKHLTMPAWKGTLSDQEIATLAGYIANPNGPDAAKGKSIFEDRCSQCHGDKLPSDGSVEVIRNVIVQGGPHETMPTWGKILSDDQIDALVQFILAPPAGIEEGRKLFEANCTSCHGQYGQGGPNPVQPGDIIQSISGTDFLSTRDDATIRAIIAQGQPDLGMVPFGTDNGGSLDDDQIDQLVAYIRSWESNPPPTPKVPTATPRPTVAGPAIAIATPGAGGISFTGNVLPIFKARCASCHGAGGGWSAADYNSVMTSGEHSPVIIPGDVKHSLLVQKLQGNQAAGMSMPPGGALPQDEIDTIVQWVQAGAPDS